MRPPMRSPNAAKEDVVLGRDFRRHLGVVWALVARRTGFPSNNDKVWLAAEVELVDLVAELFGLRGDLKLPFPNRHDHQRFPKQHRQTGPDPVAHNEDRRAGD